MKLGGSSAKTGSISGKKIHQSDLEEKNQGRLKPKPVKAQKTTSKRIQCTVVQQYCWFKNYEKAPSFIRNKNTGLCKHAGKTFGELIDYFICGADETCMPCDNQGNIKVCGEVGGEEAREEGRRLLRENHHVSFGHSRGT